MKKETESDKAEIKINVEPLEETNQEVSERDESGVTESNIEYSF